MIETGVLIAKNGEPIFWHMPSGRTTVSLPDTADLWSIIWANRDRILGFAHTHPGLGFPVPSAEDLSTFRAIEGALGQRLVWWIATVNRLIVIRHEEIDESTGVIRWGPYLGSVGMMEPAWLYRLRQLSNMEREVVL